MRQKSNSNALSSEEMVKGIRRATRKRYSAEEKIRIVLDGLRGEHSIAELCRREGIAESLPIPVWSCSASPLERCSLCSTVGTPRGIDHLYSREAQSGGVAFQASWGSSSLVSPPF